MPDREKVIAALTLCANGEPCYKDKYKNCLYSPIGKADGYNCGGAMAADALALLRDQEVVADEFMRSWLTIKFSVMDTANNNAGPDGNEDVHRILTWVATMMDQQEAKWDA